MTAQPASTNGLLSKDTRSKRFAGWRRPPLVLVAFGLAIAYAEIAIETEVLAENGLEVKGTAGAPSVATLVGGDIAGGFAKRFIAQWLVGERPDR